MSHRDPARPAGSQVLRVLWAIITFPFWALGLLFSLLGRLVLALLGFSLMTAGLALWMHGLYVPAALALFVCGLVLFIRAVV